MIWLRLNHLQLALALLAVALLLGAIAALALPPPELPESGPPSGEDAKQVAFEAPLYAIASDPVSPLVERNTFDPSRQPPAQRWTSTSSADEEAALLPNQPPAVNFVLLGTVTGTGRDIAVIQGNPNVPGGATYHIGGEPSPGYRVTRITRDKATIVGPDGKPIELTVQKASTLGTEAVQ